MKRTNFQRVMALLICLTFVVGSFAVTATAAQDKTDTSGQDSSSSSGDIYDSSSILEMLDLISYDCTYGIWDRGRVTHMHLPLCIEVRERLRSEGLLNDGAKHLLTHFSHRDGGCGYEIFAPIAEKEGFTVAYDGLTVEF